MAVVNQIMAMGALGALKKNQQKLGDQARKVSSGEAFPDSHYGPEVYSISEKMRVQIRALEQNDENTKKGQDMLKVAEGGLQSQLDMLRQIKQKVIDAANDTNTDDDRVTIQKELNELYNHIETVAHSTEYNGQKVLIGDEFYQTKHVWKILDAPVYIENSDEMDVISNNFPTLDGIEGPFDDFLDYKSPKSSSINALGISPSIEFKDGGSSYTVSAKSVSDLYDVGISVRHITSDNPEPIRYVFTNDPSKNYSGSYYQLSGGTVHEIVSSFIPVDISGCSTPQEAFEKLSQAAGTNFSYEIEDGTTVAKTTTKRISSVSGSDFPAQNAVDSVPGSGISGKFSGGVDYQAGDGVDLQPVQAQTAKFTSNTSGASVGSGFTISRFNGSEKVEIVFVEGSQAPTLNSDGRYEVGIDWSGTHKVGGYPISIDAAGILEVQANSTGSWANYSSYLKIDDGVEARPATNAIDGTKYTSVKSQIDDAVATIDLSGYHTTDSDALENFIDSLVNKYIYWYSSNSIEFIDTQNPGTYDSLDKYKASDYDNINLDLNSIRTAVSNGTTIADAFANAMSNLSSYISVGLDDSGNVQSVKIKSDYSGVAGNGKKLTAYDTGELMRYEIKYGEWFSNHPDADIPAYLDGKGFRVYCATDEEQWFNFSFSNGNDSDAPESGSGSSLDYRTIRIDVSGVTDAKSLIQAIYDQGEPQMAEINHYLHLYTDLDEGKLVVYDSRNKSKSTLKYQYSDYQERGAKITDGVLDNVVKYEKKLLAKKVVIQDTEKSNSYITLHIPQTTLDHIFWSIPEPKTIKDYPVTSKKSRNELLGPPDPGIIDHGIDYVLEAITEVGAQMKRVELSNSNIVTKRENAQASESTIRDADMAKEMVEYTKSNMLSQAAQSMLAQSNQNMAHVLELLR